MSGLAILSQKSLSISISDDNAVNKDNHDTEVQNQTEVESVVDNPPSEVVKMINAPDLDYSKMQVSALKKMVSERNLASGVSKLRKQELIDILEQN